MDATLVAFAEACNFIADVARREHTTNKVKVQQACYREVRSRFGLSANLAIRAIARVCAALKVKSKAHATFEPTSIDYDQRIFSFREWDWTFSLTLLESRARLDTTLGDFQKGRLKGSIPTSATLAKRRGGVQSPRRWRAARPRRSGLHVSNLPSVWSSWSSLWSQIFLYTLQRGHRCGLECRHEHRCSRSRCNPA